MKTIEEILERYELNLISATIASYPYSPWYSDERRQEVLADIEKVIQERIREYIKEHDLVKFTVKDAFDNLPEDLPNESK